MRFLLLCLVFCGTLPALLGCSCADDLPQTPAMIAESFGWADAVLLGEVREATADKTVFLVLRGFKGVQAGDVITSRLFDSCSTLYKDGFHLLYGQLTETGELNTSYCSINKKLREQDFADALPTGASFADFLANEGVAHDLHLALLGEYQNDQATMSEPTDPGFPYARFVFFLLFLVMVLVWWVPVLRRGFR